MQSSRQYNRTPSPKKFAWPRHSLQSNSAPGKISVHRGKSLLLQNQEEILENINHAQKNFNVIYKQHMRFRSNLEKMRSEKKEGVGQIAVDSVPRNPFDRNRSGKDKIRKLCMTFKL